MAEQKISTKISTQGIAYQYFCANRQLKGIALNDIECEAGNATDGELKKPNPTIVFLHGVGLNQSIWQPFIKPLLEQYNILTYDLSGHGDSTIVQSQPSLTDCANHLYQLLCELNLSQAHLVGFSLGGMINRKFACLYPAMVQSLSILNTPHNRNQELQQKAEQRAKKSSEHGIKASLEITIDRWFTKDYQHNHPTKVEWIRQMLLSNNVLNYAHFHWLLAHSLPELTTLTDEALQIPTLIITCENDIGSNVSMAQEMHQAFKNSHLHIIPKLQHLGLIEQPELFITSLQRFLNQIYIE